MAKYLNLDGIPVRVAGIILACATLAGCEEGPKLAFLQPGAETEATEGTPSTTTKLVERDVESPDVFQAAEAGLWDGRPSLGGVWVAHPDVENPERVIIRNKSNGKFVIGALFRRERAIPGPRLQASSDAAAALGMLAGAPVELDVTALRRETVEETPEPTLIEKPAEVQTASLDSGPISETALDPIAAAAAAIDAAAPKTEAKPAETSAKAKPTKTTSSQAVAAATAPAKSTSSLSNPYVQIGIFSIEDNANRTADQMRSAGMVPTVFRENLGGKTYWRVVVGPAKTKSELSALLKQIRKTGFSDAFAVAN